MQKGRGVTAAAFQLSVVVVGTDPAFALTLDLTWTLTLGANLGA